MAKCIFFKFDWVKPREVPVKDDDRLADLNQFWIDPVSLQGPRCRWGFARHRCLRRIGWSVSGAQKARRWVKGSIRDGQRQRWLNALSRPLPGAASFSRHNPHPPLSPWLYMSYLAHRAMLQWRVVDFRSINDTVISSFMYIRIAGLPLPLESLARRIRVRGYLTLVHFFYRESWPLRVQGFEVESSRWRAVSCLQILYPVKIFVPSFQDDAPTETGY